MCELLVVGQNQLIQSLAMTEPGIQIFLPSNVTVGLGYFWTKSNGRLPLKIYILTILLFFNSRKPQRVLLVLGDQIADAEDKKIFDSDFAAGD